MIYLFIYDKKHSITSLAEDPRFEPIFFFVYFIYTCV